jgi:hypothetical protein
LKNVCVTFENKLFDAERTHAIKVWLKAKAPVVLEFVNKVLGQIEQE